MKKHIINGLIALILFICILVMFIYSLQLDDGNCITGISACLGAFVTAVSILCAAENFIIQLSESRKQSKAEFLLNLNQTFVSTEMYSEVYTFLENEYLNHKNEDAMESTEPVKKSSEMTESKPSRAKISNYLTFFECIYKLVEEKVVDMDSLDDLFEYRFFLAAHNDVFQKEKLLSQPENFKNIYYLERLWTNYRRKKGFPIIEEENCLDQRLKEIEQGEEKYNNIMKDYPDRFKKKYER